MVKIQRIMLMSNKNMVKNLPRIMLFLLLLIPFYGRPNASNIILTPANPTVLSNGRGYYLAGRQYLFRVQVIDPAAAAWNNITNIRLVIPNSVNAAFQTGALTGAAPVVTVTSGGVIVTATAPSGTYNNFFIDFTVTFRWNSPESAWTTAPNNIMAYVSTNNPAVVTDFASSPAAVNYGVCSSLRALNISADGDASDSRVTRWHENFNVTADAVVYNIPGAGAADSVDSVDPGEMSSVRLSFDGNIYGSDNTYPAIGINLADAGLQTLGYTFSVTPISVALSVLMDTAGGPEVTVNPLSIYCNEVEINHITNDPLSFYDGGGVDASPLYYRSIPVSGAKVRVYARMRAGGGAMTGTVTAVLRDTADGTLTNVIIANNDITGTANLTYSGLTIPSGSTGARTYQIISVSGGAYGSGINFGQNRTNPAYISQPAFRTINWDNIDPPGNNAALFNGGTFTSPSQTADSITLSWSPISGAFPDGDFYSYRIYYRTGTDPFAMVDRNTLPAADYAVLSNPANSTVILKGLAQFTNYDIILSAVDVFGHEADPANRPAISYSTTSSSTDVTISDGITTYNALNFSSDPDPAANIIFNGSSVFVTAKIITGGNPPQSVNIIAADNLSDVQHSTGSADDILSLPSTDYYRIPMRKTAPNTWKGQIQSTLPIMAAGKTVRFIIESVFSGAPSYTDVDAEPVPPGNHWLHEWRFFNNVTADFIPWPAKIFNNVINNKNPVAYPAYYLTTDSYVTITVYDMKGRPLIKLLENVYRKAGKNIREGGWRGINSQGRKVAPGLYYVKITAKSVITGKTVINETCKVVVSQ